jgi:ribosomal protein S21
MTNLLVIVHDYNVERALATLKKKIITTGLVADRRRHEFFMAPSLARRMKSIRARKNRAKAMVRHLDMRKMAELDRQGIR